MLDRVIIIPEYITIDGPASIINNIEVIHTENIVIDDKNEKFSRDIKILKVHEDNVNYDISRVNVTAEIVETKE